MFKIRFDTWAVRERNWTRWFPGGNSRHVSRSERRGYNKALITRLPIHIATHTPAELVYDN